MNKKRKQIIAGNKISEIYTFELGGYLQKILIEGKHEELPVVITLHGGPGTPTPFSVGCRGMFPEYTDNFIMVYWDQLGCGINNHPIGEEFTIDTFVNMTLDLLNEVKTLFPNNKIYLFGMSWGSILSAITAEKAKDVIDGVMVWGQITKNLFVNDEVLNAFEQSKLPKDKLDKIRKINIENVTSDEMQLVSSSLRKYTSAYTNRNGKQAPMGSIIWNLLTSPDYKFADFKAMMVNGYYKNISLWKEILKVDLTGILENIQVPYMILQGDTDVVTPTKMVQELVESSNNPNLKFEVVANSGHQPGVEGMERVLEMFIALK